VVGVLAILTLWVLPPVGFVACLGMLAIAAPWGRGLVERWLISLVLVAGIAAIVLPRAGSLPVTVTSARVAVSVAVAACLLLWLLIRRTPRLPQVGVVDALVLLLGAGLAWWMLAAYVGQDAYHLVSGMYFSGWDNQGHFVPFANTVDVGSLRWPTIDGSIAWNQWYPALHTVTWSVAHLASTSAAASIGAVDRVALLWPYLQWTAVCFAASLAALSWVAGDLATRITRTGARGWSGTTVVGPIAVLVFAGFAFLGFPTLMFNAGFTNFVMGVAALTVTAYLAARSWRSARLLGVALVPLGALAVIGLWTPLVLGLVPAGVIVTIALWRTSQFSARPWLRWLTSLGWAAGTVALIAAITWLQGRAIVAADAGGTTSSLAEGLGSVGVGMVPFNLGPAIAAPIAACGVAALLWRARAVPLGVAVAGASVGFVPFIVLAASAADSADVDRLGSYYLLKSLAALLLISAPTLAALGACLAAVVVTVVIRAVRSTGQRRRGTVDAVIALAIGAVLMVGGFGYVGALPESFLPGFAAAPGLAAGQARVQSVNNALVGESIIEARNKAIEVPERTSMLWDGSGTLPNLWVRSLTGVMTQQENKFYTGLPSFPYDDKAIEYLQLSLVRYPEMNLALLWFRPVSGVQLQRFADQWPERVELVRVIMRPSPLCPECQPVS
ncbi:MAG: hypothetical protein ACKN9D_05780, partial [Actinomycetales bacterium]